MIKNYSLRARLLLWVLGSNIILWVTAGALVWRDASHDLEQLLNHMADNSLTQEALLHERQELLSELVWSLIWPLVVGLPILALVITFVIYRANRSLSRLGSNLANRKPLTFTPVLSNDLPSELVPVVNELNHLFTRMQQSVEKEQRFTADAAHELRTPIAAMRAQAQVAAMCDGVADQQHALNELMVSCDRGSHLVAQLLALARLESPIQALKTEKTFDLIKLLREVMALMMTEAQAKQQNFYFDQDSEDQVVMVTADEALLGMLFRNLFDNAIRYSPLNAEITVKVQISNANPNVLIEDSGPGMPESDILRLGERFFRSQSNNSAGSGLGWSIVRQIAAAQNLRLKVDRSERLGGLRVQVCISH